ncbi:MAG: glycoside hydrolase family 127 protein [Candidatus Binatia bacterium]
MRARRCTPGEGWVSSCARCRSPERSLPATAGAAARPAGSRRAARCGGATSRRRRLDWRRTGNRALLDGMGAAWRTMVTEHAYVSGVGARAIVEGFDRPYALGNASAYCETCAAPACCGATRCTSPRRTRHSPTSSNGSSTTPSPWGSRSTAGATCTATRSSRPTASSEAPVVRRRLLPEQRVAHLGRARRAGRARRIATCGSTSTGAPARSTSLDRVRRCGCASTPTCRGTGAPRSRSTRRRPSTPPCISASRAGPAPRRCGATARRFRWPPRRPARRRQRRRASRRSRRATSRSGPWHGRSRLEVELPMAPRVHRADPRVSDDRGKVALSRGPILYCLEAVDHPDVRIPGAVVDLSAPLALDVADDLDGSVAISARTPGGARLRFVPYFAWANRARGGMQVWVDESRAPAEARSREADARSAAPPIAGETR